MRTPAASAFSIAFLNTMLSNPTSQLALMITAGLLNQIFPQFPLEVFMASGDARVHYRDDHVSGFVGPRPGGLGLETAPSPLLVEQRVIWPRERPHSTILLHVSEAQLCLF